MCEAGGVVTEAEGAVTEAEGVAQEPHVEEQEVGRLVCTAQDVRCTLAAPAFV